MTVDKGGVHIDQCQGCRGIWLDRGELERIVGAESSYYGGGQAAPQAYRPDSPKPYQGGGGHADSPRPYGRQQHRKRGFLENLFD
jgi:uncharacterized protein